MQLVSEKPSPLSAADPVVCKRMRGPDFGDTWHYHPACEFTLVLRGGTERWVGDRIEPLTPGDLVFLGSELPHEYRNAPIPGRRARQTEWVVVHFMPQILGDIGQACTTLAPLRRLFERARRGLRVDGSTRGQAEALLLEMAHAQGLRRAILLLELLDLLSTSSHLTELSSEGFRMEAQSPVSDRIGTVCTHIESHLDAPLRVPDLARGIGLSESALGRLFRKCTNGTVTQYVNRLRIAHACRLLAETDKTVAEIMLACGYASPAHFQRQFQRYQHRTPLAYRRSVRAPF